MDCETNSKLSLKLLDKPSTPNRKNYPRLLEQKYNNYKNNVKVEGFLLILW
jgi:hypothetical protein